MTEAFWRLPGESVLKSGTTSATAGVAAKHVCASPLEGLGSHEELGGVPREAVP